MTRRRALADQVAALKAANAGLEDDLAACSASKVTLQAEADAAHATITQQQSALAAAVMDKATLEVELTAEREANAGLSEQGEQLRADLAAATTEIARLRAIIDAVPPPPDPPPPQSLQDQIQQFD